MKRKSTTELAAIAHQNRTAEKLVTGPSKYTKSRGYIDVGIPTASSEDLNT